MHIQSLTATNADYVLFKQGGMYALQTKKDPKRAYVFNEQKEAVLNGEHLYSEIRIRKEDNFDAGEFDEGRVKNGGWIDYYADFGAAALKKIDEAEGTSSALDFDSIVDTLKVQVTGYEYEV